MTPLDLVLSRLACPVCTADLTRYERTVRCSAGHSFDLARQGYLPLLSGAGRAGQGDTAEMVAARETFLASGHYAPISTAVAEAAATAVAGADAGAGRGASAEAIVEVGRSEPLVVDLAGGTGHHLAAVLHQLPHAVGLDLELSAPALRRAARAHPRLAAVRADIWQPLPLSDGAAEIVLSIFGPRNAAEITRVLTSTTGRLVVVTPDQAHLQEIIGPLGMIGVAPDKDERVARQLGAFTVVENRSVRYPATMTRADLRNEVLMGPSAHHVDQSELDSRLETAPPATDVTVAVTVTTYRVT